MSLRNKELLVLVNGTIAEHKETGFPLSHDNTVALFRMVKALFPFTTPEHQIDTISRMKVLIDPREGLKIKKSDSEILDAGIAAMQARPQDSVMTIEDAKCFLQTVRMALMRLDPDKPACCGLGKIVEAFH